KLRIGGAPLVVIGDDIFERRETPVMHIGGGACDLSESRRLERSPVSPELGDEMSADVRFIEIDTDSQIVKCIVGEVRSDMTRAAMGFAEKQIFPALGRFRQRRLITVDET